MNRNIIYVTVVVLAVTLFAWIAGFAQGILLTMQLEDDTNGE